MFNAVKKIVILLVITGMCSSMVPVGAVGAQELSSSDRARLERELEQVEKQIKEQEAILNSQKQQSVSIERDIAILTAKINAAKLRIKAKNLEIETLSKDITKKAGVINDLTAKLEREKDSLGQILRRANELDSYTLPEILLAKEDLSTFLEDADAFDALQKALHESFDELESTRTTTTKEKESLQKRRDAETDARKVIEEEQRSIQKDEATKRQLLTASRSQEQAYASILAERAARAAAIRSALFKLRDAAAIPFEQALQYATAASKLTGVRPAFVLAILTQESNLGQNVGSCYLTNKETGAGVSIKSGNSFPNVMKPTRDVAPFFDITQDLGRDPYKTLVSCPQSVGWGGAMGPAQFIPSTWVIFKDRIAKALGKKASDPWNPQDAFMASSMYLGDLGAVAGSYTAERNAACRYYSGRACAIGDINMTYGNQVMARVQALQDNIDILSGI